MKYVLGLLIFVLLKGDTLTFCAVYLIDSSQPGQIFDGIGAISGGGVSTNIFDIDVHIVPLIISLLYQSILSVNMSFI